MLFYANITHEVAQDPDKLVEQLYIFLRNFVPKRIRYEDQATREDCIQSTIMFMLNRFKGLKETEVLDHKFNYEKYFYNRANSYISLWLRNLKKDRDNKRGYMEYYYYLLQPEKTIDNDLIDVIMLKEIVSEYNLDEILTDALRVNVTSKLVDLGYYAIPEFIPNLGKAKNDFIESLSYNAVDEYLIRDAKIKLKVE